MQYRILGRTGIKVSEIGFGCWGMGGGWGPLNDKEALNSMQMALEKGVNFFDTALAYGNGHSEKLVSEISRPKGPHDPVIIATKIPPNNWQWPARHDVPIQEVFPKKWIIECTEKSLKNLKTECLELQQFHVWSDSWAHEEEWKETISSLKKQGKIKYIGVSINDNDPDSALKVIGTGLIDTVQVIYNIFDQSPEDKLFPLCKKMNIGVIVRVPLDEGGLSGKLTPEIEFHRKDWRRDYFKGENLIETCRRAEAFQFLIRDEIKTLAQGALKFCLSHPAVSTVIAGMRKASHVQENCSVSDGKYLRSEELVKLKSHIWKRQN